MINNAERARRSQRAQIVHTAAAILKDDALTDAELRLARAVELRAAAMVAKLAATQGPAGRYRPIGKREK